jgi:hypothetical protein
VGDHETQVLHGWRRVASTGRYSMSLISMNLGWSKWWLFSILHLHRSVLLSAATNNNVQSVQRGGGWYLAGLGGKDIACGGPWIGTGEVQATHSRPPTRPHFFEEKCLPVEKKSQLFFQSFL